MMFPVFKHPTGRSWLGRLPVLLLVVLAGQSVSAQSLLSSGESKPDGGRPKSTQVGFFELMESGGDAMLDLFQPDHQQFTAESPEYNSQASPRDAIMTFVEAMIGSAKIFMQPALSSFRWNLIEAAMVLAGVYLVVSLIELVCLGVRRTFYGDDDPYAKMISLVIRRRLRVFATVILLLFIFQNVFKWNVTALIGGFSIIALALSLAAQDAVKNLFGALTIFANRPFIKGDWIKFADEIGQVDDVSLQVTRVRLLSGEVLSVPNMKLIDDTVENMSMRKYLRRISVATS